MVQKSLGVLVTTYNDPTLLLNECLRSIHDQDYESLVLVVVDDGSVDPVADRIEFPFEAGRLQILSLPHGERAVARATGIDFLKQLGVEYLLFLDSDMMLPPGLLRELMLYAEDSQSDCVVIPETAYSSATNYWTRVKVFERNLYRAGGKVGATSIEAARLWRFDRFPGFVDGLNAFEEIQPTLTCLRNGGRVGKLESTFILHDEKQVTLRGLLQKKAYYFSEMGGHQAVRFYDVLKRFYFFRTQLYRKENLMQYLRFPTLTVGVLLLYTVLTAIAGVKLFRKTLPMG